MLKIRIEKMILEEKLFECNMSLGQQYYLINGENGSGKTTLFNIISKYDKDYDGQIMIGNQNLKSIPELKLRNNIVNYLLQDNNLLLELTCIENLEVLVGDYEESLLTEVVTLLSFDKILKSQKKVKLLSGGEKQKLSLLIAVMRPGKIYLIDELENNLDEETKNNLSKIIKKIRGIVLINTHNPEYYQKLNPENIILENRRFILQENNNKYEYNKEKIINNKEQLAKKDYKLLCKYNRIKRYIFTMVMITISILVILLATDTILISQYVTKPKAQFSTNTSIITSPKNSIYYDVLGDESWLKKIKVNFTQEDLQKLEALDYIGLIKPIPRTNSNVGSLALYQNADTFIYEKDTDLLSLNYKDYKLDKYMTNQIVTTNIVNLLYPQKYYQNTPFKSGTSVEKILYGTYPEDNSNQIIISQFTALELAEKLKLEKIENLIGKTINYKLVNTASNKEQNFGFQISGIYELLGKGEVKTYQENPIYVSYNENNEIVQRNNCSLYPENQNKLKNICLKLDADIDLEQELSAEQLAKIGEYPAFLIEVNNEKNIENLVEDVKKYNPYIDVDNNYSRAQSTSFVYLKRQIIKVLLMLISIFVILAIIIKLMQKLIENTNQQVITILNHYGIQGGKKLIIFEYKKIIRLLVIILSLIELIWWIGFDIEFKIIKLLLIINAMIFGMSLMLMKGMKDEK